jgi:hypothetical protein
MIMKQRWHWFLPVAVGIWAVVVLIVDHNALVRAVAVAALVLTLAGSWLVARGR